MAAATQVADMTGVALLTVEQAGRRLGVGRTMAYSFVADGDLPVLDVRRKGMKRPKLRVRVHDVDALIQRLAEAS